jgi:hypothetical protein
MVFIFCILNQSSWQRFKCFLFYIFYVGCTHPISFQWFVVTCAYSSGFSRGVCEENPHAASPLSHMWGGTTKGKKPTHVTSLLSLVELTLKTHLGVDPGEVLGTRSFWNCPWFPRILDTFAFSFQVNLQSIILFWKIIFWFDFQKTIGLVNLVIVSAILECMH